MPSLLCVRAARCRTPRRTNSVRLSLNWQFADGGSTVAPGLTRLLFPRSLQGYVLMISLSCSSGLLASSPSPALVPRTRSPAQSSSPALDAALHTLLALADQAVPGGLQPARRRPRWIPDGLGPVVRRRQRRPAPDRVRPPRERWALGCAGKGFVHGIPDHDGRPSAPVRQGPGPAGGVCEL